MEDLEKLYNERVARFVATVEHKEPDIVPIASIAGEYQPSYAGHSLWEVLEDPELELQCYVKCFRDIYCDAVKNIGLNRNMKLYDILGNNCFMVTNDGKSLQHVERVYMEKEDYPAFLQNYHKYIDDVFYPRKYPFFSLPYEERKEVLKKAVLAQIEYGKRQQYNAKYVKEQWGLPLFSIAMMFETLDYVFDFLRGFRPTVRDMHTMPEVLDQALDLFTDYIISTRGLEDIEYAPFPWTSIPGHCATFLSVKQFERFYWPSLKRNLMALYEKGIKVFLMTEGDWTLFQDFFFDLPKDFMILSIERDDIYEAKKRIGDIVTLFGGMKTDTLRYKTEQECIDEAKKLVDVCAPGGGFVFSTDRILISQADVNPANYIAVSNFVHEYGKYR